MPFKDPAKRKAYLQDWVRKNRERVNARLSAYNAKMHAASDVWAAKRRKYNGLPEPTRPYPNPALCEICGVSPGNGRTKRLHLDHDHITEKFRGWLCRACNHMIGNAYDSADVLRKAATYLDRSNQ